jgi:hypothetical protein
MNRYTAIAVNHRQVALCSEYRRLLQKPRTEKTDKKIKRLAKKLGIGE